jgi:hypothetical protein
MHTSNAANGANAFKAALPLLNSLRGDVSTKSRD